MVVVEFVHDTIVLAAYGCGRIVRAFDCGRAGKMPDPDCFNMEDLRRIVVKRVAMERQLKKQQKPAKICGFM